MSFVYAEKYYDDSLTHQANESMIETYDRMPVIVGENEVRVYLTDAAAAQEIIATAAPLLTRQRAPVS